MSENEVKDIWNRIVVIPFTKNTITHYDALLRELQITRERGWAVDNEENEPGVLCVGASIIDFSGTPIGAISVSGPVIHMSEEKRKLCTREVVQSARAAPLPSRSSNPCCSRPSAPTNEIMGQG